MRCWRLQASRSMFKCLCVRSSLSWPRNNLGLYCSPFLKSDQLWSLFFYREGHRFIEKITFNFIFWEKFYLHFTVRGAYAQRRIFSFWKNFGPGNIRWVLSCLADWNYCYSVCTINQKRSLSVIWHKDNAR